MQNSKIRYNLYLKRKRGINIITYDNYIRKEFIEGLIYFSNGKISEQEALSISEKRLRLTDFSDDSPLAHKGPRWFAKRVIQTINI